VATAAGQERLLEVRELSVRFPSANGWVHAVDGVDLTAFRGRTLGIVGESGCGKSVMSLAVMGLLPPTARLGGEIVYHRENEAPLDLVQLDPDGSRMRALRGREIAMVYQEPMTSLNPVYTVGAQIDEAIRLHHRVSRRAAREQTVELLARVGMPAPRQRARDYPHQLSGGMRQRVVIAMALACRPRLLICDEPTTALDVTIQAQILELIQSVQKEMGTAVLMITHDLGVVAEVADEVAVMYMGKVVEYGPVRTVFRRRAHPYTQGLFRSLPDPDGGKRRLEPIPGMVPDPGRLPPGCSFADRCPQRMPRCGEEPPVVKLSGGHTVRCWLHGSASGVRSQRSELAAKVSDQS